jgi:hypothetical protein
MSKSIVINLGDHGAIITLQKGNSIDKKLFVNKLTPEAIEQLRQFFNKNKTSSIYILLDTIGQNYNHKTFPAVNIFDLYSLVNRKFEQEIPKKDLKGKIFIDRDNATKKWNYLFISTAIESPLKEWLNFINTLQNRLYGIYFLPLEMQNFAACLLKKMQFTKNLRPKWLLIITQNKVSDLRQIATNRDILIFTRLLNSELMKQNFGEKLKTDILRTCEYLKRFSTSFQMKDLMVITITDKTIKESLKDIKIQNINFVKFTPYEVAQKFKLSEDVTNADAKFFDILISNIFLRSKKVLRFYDTKMAKLNKLFFAYYALRKMILALLILIGLTVTLRIYSKMNYDIKADEIKNEIANTKKMLQVKKEWEFGLEKGNIEEIIEIGNISQLIQKAKKSPNASFNKFYEVQKDLSIAYNIKWGLVNFDYQKLNTRVKTNTVYDVILLNESGNIDDLFKNFDIFSKKIANLFPKEKVDHSRLPSNIDFNKQYRSFPIKINIEEN